MWPLCCRGVEIETRSSRLGLGRVSVLRGEGPLMGEPCIDDYIRATEPIYDYMTKWSGLVCFRDPRNPYLCCILSKCLMTWHCSATPYSDSM